MKIIIFMGLFVFFTLSANAQNAAPDISVIGDIDSLESIIYNTNVSPETAPELNQTCQKLADLYSTLSFSQQIEYASNIEVITDKLGNKDISVLLLSILANAYFEKGENEKSIEEYYKVYNLYSMGVDEIKTAQALMKIGLNYYILNKYMKAKDYFERALVIFKRNQFFVGIAEALQNIALQLSHWGEYEDALQYNYEAINFWKEMDNVFQVASVNYNIGIIYMELGDLVRANECFEKSLNLFKEINSVKELVNTLIRIGDIHLQKNEEDEALEYYQKADLIGKQIDDKNLEAETAFNLGKAYNNSGDSFKAIDFLRKAIKLMKKIII